VKNFWSYLKSVAANVWSSIKGACAEVVNYFTEPVLIPVATETGELSVDGVKNIRWQGLALLVVLVVAFFVPLVMKLLAATIIFMLAAEAAKRLLQ